MKHLVPYNKNSVENLINSCVECVDLQKKIYSSKSINDLFNCLSTSKTS